MENSYTDCIVPPEPVDGPVDGGFIGPGGESKGRPKDIFGYGKFGGRLLNIVCNMQTPLVFALTGGWGSGKSVFAKQWAGELQKRWADNAKSGEKREPKNAPVIYFDAFANDYQDNAFVALAAEAVSALDKCGVKTEDLKEKAGNIGKSLFSAVANAFVHWLSGGATNAKKITADMQNVLMKRMDGAMENRAALDSFRKALENAAKELGGGQPLVFIVDELDRCRPDFALELLEKIKHLFSVPNVCFVVVTNLEQFKAVVQRTYGYNAKESRAYLDKFFHHVFQLPQVQDKARLYVEHFLQSHILPYHDRRNVVRDILTALAILHRLELRDIERIFAVVALIGASVKDDEFFVNYKGVFTVSLCVMRHVNPALYEKMANGSLSWREADEFMQFSEWERWVARRYVEACKNMWAGMLKKPPEDLESAEKYFSNLSHEFMELPQLIEELDSGRL